jgi:ribosomal protein S18 acetylase RimI-like enzyme
VEIRDFTIHDHDSVYQIALDSWNIAYAERYSIKQIEDIITDWYSIENHSGMIPLINNRQLFYKVILVDGSIIGFILGDITSCKLNRLYISPHYFHNGYGTLLLRLFEDKLIKSNNYYIIVTCDKLNTIGMNFYVKNGFIIINEDEEEYELRKELK